MYRLIAPLLLSSLVHFVIPGDGVPRPGQSHWQQSSNNEGVVNNEDRQVNNEDRKKNNERELMTSGEGSYDVDLEAGGDDMWLEDFEIFPVEEMQSDAPGYLGAPVVGTCPPTPVHLPDDACQAVPCTYDVECSLLSDTIGSLCCDNGCMKTCMKPMSPAAYIDWRKKLLQLRKTGFSWLLKSEEDEEKSVDWCSTSSLFRNDADEEDDEDPTLCPHGYVCHIEYPGNTQHHIPNRGRCVPETSLPSDFPHRVRFQDTSADISLSSCTFHDKVLQSGQTFTYHGHPCTCSSGAVLCNVAFSLVT